MAKGITNCCLTMFLLVASTSTAQDGGAHALSEPWLQGAASSMEQGKFKEAREQLLQVTAEHPDSAEAFALLGVAEMQLHDPAAAHTSLRRALEINPNSSDGLYNMGVLLLEDEHPRQAITYFEKLSQAHGFTPELAVNLVRAQLEAGDRPGASRSAQDAARAFPKLPAIHLALGTAFLRNGSFAEAANFLKQADELAPSEPQILFPLADACLELPDLSCAQSALAKLKTRYEGDAEFHFLSGKAALLEGHGKEGLQEFQLAVEAEPRNVNYLLTLARYQQKYGQQQQAIKLFNEARSLAPRNPEVPYGLALSYFIQDEFVQAGEFASQAVGLDAKFDRALFLLGISRFAQNQFSAADKALGEALRLQPENAFYRCFQGMVLLSADRLPEASNNLREATRLRPDYALAHFQLGRTMIRMKNYLDARTELERAVSLQPDLGEAYYQLSIAYRQLGEKQKALDAVARFKQFRTAQDDERTRVLKAAQDALQSRP